MSRELTIDYRIGFTKYNQHIANVELVFIANKDKPIVWLPSWLAGSYLMREFARHITNVEYQGSTDKKYRAEKVSKNEWQLDLARVGDTVRVRYEVYCYDLSVRTAYVDNQRIFGNFSSLALAVEGQEDTAVSVELSIPEGFYQGKELRMACGLPSTKESFADKRTSTVKANNYDELIDYPFEIAEQSEFGFSTHTNEMDQNNQNTKSREVPHTFFISGRHQFDENRLKTDVQKICQAYNTWLEDTPFQHYTFMTFASGNDYGGLEHINSTALIIPRDDLPTYAEKNEPSDNYQRYLGLCSHEYFHAWWVKTVRPDVMMEVDLRKEAYTPLLWVFEGFTSYIDDFMLQASGVINQQSYLKLLTAQINRYYQTDGRSLQSVAESSFDAWIKLYRADENTSNAGISYYNKGALVALCLDLLLLKQTNGKYRLFDIVKSFYQRAKRNDNRRIGMTDNNLSQLISLFIDEQVWNEFYQNYIIGVKPLPVAEYLNEQGIMMVDGDLQQPWGIVATEDNQGLSIKKVNRDSVASEAGLSAKDVIVAIDGLKATKKQLTKIAKLQQHDQHSVTCYAFRRDELIQFDVSAKNMNGISANANIHKFTLSIDSADNVNQWLNGLNIR